MNWAWLWTRISLKDPDCRASKVMVYWRYSEKNKEIVWNICLNILYGSTQTWKFLNLKQFNRWLGHDMGNWQQTRRLLIHWFPPRDDGAFYIQSIARVNVKRIVQKSKLWKSTFMWEKSHKFHLSRTNQRCPCILATTFIWQITGVDFFPTARQRSSAYQNGPIHCVASLWLVR